jgi:creatinine amidohydrolase
VGAPEPLRWEALAKRAFDRIDRERAVVLLTCSPLEVHGPHLPLGADALEGEGLAERMLRFLPERHRGRTFLKLPFIYAASDVVQQPGSLYFQPSTTVRLLVDLARTLGAQGFRHVWVSNFHGGPRHLLAIERACTRANRRHRTRMVSIFSLMIARLTGGTANLDRVLAREAGPLAPDLSGDTHGGLVETSQLLALHGAWVDPEYKSLPRQTVDLWLAERGEGRPHAPRGAWRRLPAVLRDLTQGLHFFDEHSYAGAPAGASAELGERIRDALAEHTARACAGLLDGTLGPEDCHSPLWRFRFLFLNPVAIRAANRIMRFRNPIA